MPHALRASFLVLGTVTGLVAATLTTTAGTATAATAAARLAPAVSAPCVESSSPTGPLATCTFPVGTTTWTVPNDVQPGSAITIDAVGQAGQREVHSNVESRGAGRGADLSADFMLKPGTALQLSRPGYGGDGGGSGASAYEQGGKEYSSGAGGGRAVVTRFNPSDRTTTTLLIAGGGGGEGSGVETDEGGWETITRGGIGGDAGLPGGVGTPGGNGEGNDPIRPGGGGGGGGTAPGGAGSPPGYVPGAGNGFSCDFIRTGPPGLPGLGGVGGNAQGPIGDDFASAALGGGGGGGLAGGGSGAGAGVDECPSDGAQSGAGAGGGGSSYVEPSALNKTASLSNLTYQDTGAMVITYYVDVTAPVPTLSSVTSPRSTPVDEISWDYGEAMNAFPKFTITRDGQPDDVPPTGITFSSDNRTGGVSIASATGAPGTYVFTLPAAGMTDIAGNPVPADVSVSWTKTLTGSFGVVDTPRDAGISSVPLTFSGPVTGLELSDIQIFRAGVPVSSSSETLTGSGTDYVLGGLDDLTEPGASPVDYEIYLDAADSGVADGPYHLSTDLDLTFTVDASTPPTASFTPVNPPDATGVDSITLTFSQPVYAVDIGDFRIFRDGIPTALTGATVTPTGTLADGASATYRIGNLGALTAPEEYPVDWELVLNGSGTSINNENDILLVNGASVDFTVTSAAAPTATIQTVASPRATGVDQLAVTFSQTVYAVDVSDFRLYRDGIPTSLDGATLTGSGADYVLGNLNEPTAAQRDPVSWVVALVADGSNITDDAGVAFADDASTSFEVDAAPAPTANFGTVSTPRPGAVDAVALTFTAPVSAVDASDFDLSRNGDDVPLDGAAITGSGTDYQLTGLTSLTAPGVDDGDYVLTLHDSGTGIVSDAGVALSRGASVAFVVQARAVSIPSALSLTSHATTSAITVNAHVTTTAVGAPPITGTVTFSVSPDTGASIICTTGAASPVIDGVAKCHLPRRVARDGTAELSITAVYSGDSNFLSAKDTLNTALPGTPISLSLAEKTSSNGQSVDLTVSVDDPGATDPLHSRTAVLVIDNVGNVAACDQFRRLAQTGTFGCRIADATTKSGVYTVLAVFYGNRQFHRSYLGRTIAIP